jgi:hypothetical protein
MAPEQYEPLTMEEAEDFIGRAEWRPAKSRLRSGKSIEDVAPHEYVVQKRGQGRDDFTEDEFWRFNARINAEGRWELWTPPSGWEGKPQKNRYLYVGEYAYWFTMPYGAVPMLNREHLSVQERDHTRTVLDEGGRPDHPSKGKAGRPGRRREGTAMGTRLRSAKTDSGWTQLLTADPNREGKKHVIAGTRYDWGEVLSRHNERGWWEIAWLNDGGVVAQVGPYRTLDEAWAAMKEQLDRLSLEASDDQ